MHTQQDEVMMFICIIYSSNVHDSPNQYIYQQLNEHVSELNKLQQQ